MEGLIILGLIVWGIVSLFSDDKCKDGHDWDFSWEESTKKRNFWTYDAKHKCRKCGKVESCDFSKSSYGIGEMECSECGCREDWCTDD